jgi:hypothetical protein
LKSIKTSYAEHVGADKVSDFIRTLMKDQHKGMLLRLRAGEFDSALNSGDAAPTPAPTSVRYSELPPMPAPQRPAAAKGAELGRYAATEPALPYLVEQVALPKDRARSLDELILGYLSEDLDG